MEMRGLSMFISDIRKSATSKESEEQRIDKEKAKIRAKFKEGTKLTGYERKKYVCKLLYMFMLGYEVDFGHMEAVTLISSDKYSEKHIGYLSCTILLNENHELLTLITNAIKSDLNSKWEYFQCLALTAIANVGGKEFAEAMANDVQKILLNRETKPIVRKKSALCLLRLYRKYPEIITPDSIVDPLLDLLGGVDFGVVNSLASLLLGFLAKDTSSFQGCVTRCIRVLAKIIITKDYTNDYVYYGVPAPWLQIKLFRILQHYPMPTDGALKNQITSVLNKIITASERIRSMDKSRTPSRNNAVNSVLMEAINLCIHYDKDRDLINMAANILGRFLTDTKDPNLRYLGLATMARLAYCAEGDAMEHIRKHQQTIVLALKDSDISIRRRALDLLYCMCDKSNAAEIVGELLDYLTVADFNIREDLVLKIAILSEKFASEYSWYVDVVLSIIGQAGDFVSDDVYHRVVQIVTNNDDIQKHSAQLVFKAVTVPNAHEVAIKVAGYILGEFGYYIAEEADSGPLEQFQALHTHFSLLSPTAKCILLTTYVKFYNMYDNAALREKIHKVFQDCKSHVNEELQQRACEYDYLVTRINENTVNGVLENMPQYNLKTSGVLQAMARANVGVADKDVWGEKELAREQAQEAERQVDHPHAGDSEDTTVVAPVPATKKQPEADLLGGDLWDTGSGGGGGTNTAPPASSGGGDSFDDMFGSTPKPQASTKPASSTPPPAAAKTGSGAGGGGSGGGDPFDSFFGGGGGGGGGGGATKQAAAPNPAPKAAAPSGDAFDDIFGNPTPTAPAAHTGGGGGGGFLDGFNMTSMAEKGLDEKQLRLIRQQFRTLQPQEGGILFEDNSMSIRIKSEVHGFTSRTVLNFGNKTGSPISELTAEIVDQPTGLQIRSNQVGSMISANSSNQQLLNIECQSGFSGHPSVKVSYMVTGVGKFKFSLPLPLVVSKFIEPLRIANNEQFVNTWHSTEGNLPSCVFFTETPIDVSRTQQLLSHGFRFTVLRAVDNNQNNLVACGQLVSKNQRPVAVLCNVENNLEKSAVRLTVKSPSEELAKEVCLSMKQTLGDKEQT